ncbi:DUF6390 family protein, partial [Streptomyces sp. NPDC059096]|uniref:DUF6390 family protein n=1 Tax=Streptomyces sp. NPDC059096 TaxID=3346727 RepID=UPI0036BDFBE5
MSERGALLFARYAYPPNELGYCGPADSGALLRPEEPAGIERHARRFEGAWCYLELLAERAGGAGTKRGGAGAQWRGGSRAQQRH